LNGRAAEKAQRRGSWRAAWTLAFVIALIAETVITFTTVFIPSTGDYYGAPIPVGLSCFDLPLGRPDCRSTFSGVLFIVDVVVTWPLWWLLARWSGTVGLLSALISSLIGIALIPVMLSYGLPIVGLPIPLGRSTPLPNSLTVWLDVMIWAVLAGALARSLRGPPSVQ
jgi:hypothetical protein